MQIPGCLLLSPCTQWAAVTTWVLDTRLPPHSTEMEPEDSRRRRRRRISGARGQVTLGHEGDIIIMRENFCHCHHLISAFLLYEHIPRSPLRTAGHAPCVMIGDTLLHVPRDTCHLPTM